LISAFLSYVIRLNTEIKEMVSTFAIVESIRRTLLSIGYPNCWILSFAAFPLICWKPHWIYPVFASILYCSLRHLNILGKKERKLVGPGLARGFFSMVENALKNVSDNDLKVAVTKFKKTAMIQDQTFHAKKVLILFPDLLECKELPNMYGLEKRGLEKLENEKQNSDPVAYIAKDTDRAIKFPYEIRGNPRTLEFAIVVLDPRSNAKRKEYFLCLDNRPLVNLYDMSMSPEDLLMEQDSYYNELRRLMDSNPNDNYDERYELLKFTGELSSALDEYSKKICYPV